MKTNYAMLLDKRLHARVKENMEKQQKAGKFRILDSRRIFHKPCHTEQAEGLGIGFACLAVCLV